jgi:site-specific DNA-cytosine methylase
MITENSKPGAGPKLPVTLNCTALELFCGIGGFAAAVAGSSLRVVGALDHSGLALEVYRRNFPGHEPRQADLEKADPAMLADFAAGFWWLSPPCQPYSVRGRRHDLDDPRARSLVRIMEVLAKMPLAGLPRHLALENVTGFAHSRARQQLHALLLARGYEVRERYLCPTELGVPSRRPRYYLVASRDGLGPPRPDVRQPLQPLCHYLDPALDDTPPIELLVPPELLARFGAGFRIIEPTAVGAYTTCFTAGYGKSLMHAGSYLKCIGGVRRFATEELLRLLHFPPGFCFPPGMPLRRRWHLLGNSLSVAAVKEILKEFSVPGRVTGRSLA